MSEEEPVILRAAISLSLAVLPVVAAPAAAANRDPSHLQRLVLTRFNTARAQVRMPPLRWDTRLEADARVYAIHLARTGVMRHDRSSLRRRTQGENLWSGSRGYWPYEVMLDSMIAERRYYRRGYFPANSVNGNWAAVGHYTQIIWPTTTAVGCALVPGRRLDFLVCRFAPRGNVSGVYLP